MGYSGAPGKDCIGISLRTNPYADHYLREGNQKRYLWSDTWPPPSGLRPSGTASRKTGATTFAAENRHARRTKIPISKIARSGPSLWTFLPSLVRTFLPSEAGRMPTLRCPVERIGTALRYTARVVRGLIVHRVDLRPAVMAHLSGQAAQSAVTRAAAAERGREAELLHGQPRFPKKNGRPHYDPESF